MIVVLESDAHALEDGEISFEQYMEPLAADYATAVLEAQDRFSYHNVIGQPTYPMSRMQAKRILDELSQSYNDDTPDVVHTLLRRKINIDPSPLRTLVLSDQSGKQLNKTLTVMPLPHKPPPVNQDVIDTLYDIRTTPYASSFLSRLLGFQPSDRPGIIACDWRTRPPWVDLMNDVHEHYTFRHPDAEHPTRVDAPIEYTTLRRDHLPQIHELLNRAFWSVTDSLEYNPEQCTIVATYRKLVVGAAFLSSPVETYITYLAVKPGFENAQIATSMLYHLISLNPQKDITLHVSTTNPAMLLYNRFGFKAEEFVVGFYEDYIESQTRGSMNAFRLRLRQ
ncbi:hypothetical protein EUX98_g6444 [Antrodiella citrinella]|uniref:N-acetyltransferase domain-containing protein n=1 Tax=Antrodiella citrinella TaxID=2447956 RepID=A0A4S4MNZ0_9APHY|nr:hypothetical protein EUX98_g6444 [Antrodiella citrinella]